MNKKAQTLSGFIIGVIVFGVVITSLGLMYTALNENYDNGVTPKEINASYVQVDPMLEISKSSYSELESLGDTDDPDGDQGYINTLVKGGYSTVIISLSSIKYIQAIIGAVGKDLPIHPIIITAAIAIILIAISFAVVKGLFKTNF